MTKNKENTIKQDKKATEQHLKKESKETNKIEENYLEQLQRLQAEFENYRNRVNKEKVEIAKYAKEELILKFLDVIDNLERATEAIEKSNNIEDIKKGIDMIFNQLNKVLEEEGIKAIKAVDKPFNPYEHEALGKEDSDKDDNVVLKEIQKGYMFKDKVIRPTKVIVSGGKKNE